MADKDDDYKHSLKPSKCKCIDQWDNAGVKNAFSQACFPEFGS